MNVSDDQKVELGKIVADLKTYLHDVENHISNDRINSIDFNLLKDKTQKLLHLCEPAEGENPVRTSTSVPKADPRIQEPREPADAVRTDQTPVPVADQHGKVANPAKVDHTSKGDTGRKK